MDGKHGVRLPRPFLRLGIPNLLIPLRLRDTEAITLAVGPPTLLRKPSAIEKINVVVPLRKPINGNPTSRGYVGVRIAAQSPHPSGRPAVFHAHGLTD